MGQIAIIGGGIGGLTASIALRLRGFQVTLYERHSAFEDVGAGLQLAPNATKVLAELGLADLCTKGASLPEHVALCDLKRGVTFLRLPVQNPAYPAAFHHIHRADLVTALAAHASDLGVELLLGAEVEITSDPQEPRGEITLSDGRSAQAVIGADGVRSALRSAYFGGKTVWHTHQTAWRALVPAEYVAPQWVEKAAMIWMGPRQHLVTYPLRGGSLINIVAAKETVAPMAQSWSDAEDPKHLQDAFSRAAPVVRELIAEITQCYLWGLFDHPPLKTWVTGRLALLGDAAHPMLPYMAQGASQAIEDAWALAACLDPKADVAEGLRAYDHARRARASRVQALSFGNSGIYHLRNPVMRRALQFGMRASSRLTPRLISSRYDWIYRYDITQALPW